MKLLLIAPEISSPYTEGRKKFVIDLIEALQGDRAIHLLTTTRRGKELHVPCTFTTTIASNGLMHLFHILRKAPELLKTMKPDIVCLFPYGTFKRHYWCISATFMWAIDKLCYYFKVPCLTIMYSIDSSTTPEVLRKLVTNLAISYKDGWTGHIVNVGLRTKNWPFLPRKSEGPPTLLFLAGMWHLSDRQMEHILSVRGLESVLKMGQYLAGDGVRLIVGSPIFKSIKYQQHILNYHANTWPNEAITLLDEVEVPSIYSQADLFVFPYQYEITQFVPTSVIESMLTGTCIAISDLKFMRHLTQNGKTGYLFNQTDPEQMSQVIREALKNKGQRREVTERAREFAIAEFSIQHSVKQIDDIVRNELCK